MVGHSEDPKPFKCLYPGCYMSFTNKQHLKRHNDVIHSENFKLKCDDCELFFKKKKHL